MLSLPDLLDAAPALARVEGDDGEEAYWQAVVKLQRASTEDVFDRCLVWCGSADADERRLGADVLGQLGDEGASRPFRHRTLPVLDRLLDDPVARVVEASLTAMSHLAPEELVERIAPLAKRAEPAVRQAVVFALLFLRTDLAVSTLIDLSRDVTASVRDWATFGLGTLDLDTVAVRDALAARLDDSDPDAQAEAVRGLASRRDSRAVAPLLRFLESCEFDSLELEAARSLGSKQLLPALERLRGHWTQDPDLLESAISACKSESD